ncbi:hypothetical protein MtrunA17_Chr5g0448461 [Medicago truncatula]|uniref:Uncharacterized protein n=1 Tax=Medicago truncatula TaxID=3880 RepID=A0A396I0D6_MEDTR|nr:hypothetical protein MtrunA17_Chr5g0448461 [Medicago truncatula]
MKFEMVAAFILYDAEIYLCVNSTFLKPSLNIMEIPLNLYLVVRQFLHFSLKFLHLVLDPSALFKLRNTWVI